MLSKVALVYWQMNVLHVCSLLSLGLVCMVVVFGAEDLAHLGQEGLVHKGLVANDTLEAAGSAVPEVILVTEAGFIYRDALATGLRCVCM